MDMRIQKKNIRLEALGRRDALSLDFRAETALNIVDHVDELGIMPGQIVSAFWPMRSEMDLRPLMAVLADRGVRLCLPAILDKQTMEFRELRPDTVMVEMALGTMGPSDASEVLDPEVMLVPLSAFDGRGHRIGYGAGFYDRAIFKLHEKGKNPRLIGIAFDCQRVEFVPDEAHDVQLAHLLSESGLHSFPAI